MKCFSPDLKILIQNLLCSIFIIEWWGRMQHGENEGFETELFSWFMAYVSLRHCGTRLPAGNKGGSSLWRGFNGCMKYWKLWSCITNSLVCYWKYARLQLSALWTAWIKWGTPMKDWETQSSFCIWWCNIHIHVEDRWLLKLEDTFYRSILVDILSACSLESTKASPIPTNLVRLL